MSAVGRFSDRVDAYVAGRPSYPAEAIDALFAPFGDPAAVVVADLGAGTGIGTRLLAARGARILAIEPNEPMRAAAPHDPHVRWLDATAERTGLEPASVDLVVAFQAFHWFEPAAALPEIARILRPRGRAAVVYNERDERDPFTAAYGELVRRFATDATEARRADALAAFAGWDGWTTVSRLTYPNPDAYDAERLRARVRSTSYLPQHGERADALIGELDGLFAAHARDGKVTLAMETRIALASRTGAAG